MRSGFITRRSEVDVRSRRIPFMATRLRTSRCTSSNTASLREQLAEPVLHRLPVALHLLLRLHLLAEQPRPYLGGLRAQLGLERVGQAVRGIGGEHDRAHPSGGAAPRRGRGHAGLAHAALARVEDRPGGHRGPESTYLLTVRLPVSTV